MQLSIPIGGKERGLVAPVTPGNGIVKDKPGSALERRMSQVTGEVITGRTINTLFANLPPDRQKDFVTLAFDSQVPKDQDAVEAAAGRLLGHITETGTTASWFGAISQAGKDTLSKRQKTDIARELRLASYKVMLASMLSEGELQIALACLTEVTRADGEKIRRLERESEQQIALGRRAVALLRQQAREKSKPPALAEEQKPEQEK